MASAEHLHRSVDADTVVSLESDPIFLRQGDWQDLGGALWGSGEQCSRQTVEVARVSRYPIVIGRGALNDWVALLGPVVSDAPAVWIVADTEAWSRHGDRLQGASGAGALIRDVLTLDVTERVKSLEAWEGVIDWLSERRVGRRDVILPFGGSALSDVVGFAAATYMRGIAYLNVPTTLVAQVDGAIGGKVAVNTHQAKNLLGAFHHPVGILSDPSVLATLPPREIACGMAEAIKTFAIESEEAFAFLEPRIESCLHGGLDALEAVVRLCSSIKMHLLRPDPFEEDLRRVLNFGHTLGHPIETVFGYRGVRHGEAVAVGMATAARIGLRRGLTAPEAADRLIGAIRRAELPIGVSKALIPAILERLDMVGSIRGGSLRYVIPCDIGRLAILEDISLDEIASALPARPSL